MDPLAPWTGDREFSRLGFRDPAGVLYRLDDRFIRVIRAESDWSFAELSALPSLAPFLQRGDLPKTREISKDEVAVIGDGVTPSLEGFQSFLEHSPVWFQSYPAEWCPPMLYDAGRLTLNLAKELLLDNHGLKDATPYNILFEGTQPILVDWLSIERRDPRNPLWLPEAQFIQSFLIPLILHQRRITFPHLTFRASCEGVKPEDAIAFFPGLRKFRPTVFRYITLPNWVASTGRVGEWNKPVRYSDPSKAEFVLRATLNRLDGHLSRLRPRGESESQWSNYLEECPYTETGWSEKSKAMSNWYTSTQPESVLDIGANTGHFSKIVAGQGARVVALDTDPICLSRLYQVASSEKLDIQPLLVDLARPSPPVGWNNQEQRSFMERSRGKFEVVQALAFCHHLLVGEGIDLTEMSDLLQSMTRRWLVVEWVGPQDPSFRRLARGRDRSALTEDRFVESFSRTMKLVHRHQLGEMDRCLYFFEKR